MAERGSSLNNLRLAGEKSPISPIPANAGYPSIAFHSDYMPVFTLSKQDPRRLSSNEGVWAFVDSSQGYAHGRRLIKFERDVCYIVEPGKNIFEVKPKKLERTDAVTLVAETGFWNYGRILIRVYSAAEADAAEQRVRPQLPKRN